MTVPEKISADYTLRPSELSEVLALLVEARQPAIVWGPPGAAKSQIAQQVATPANRRYVDIRALLLDPVDLRGIPWRDTDDRTRWAPPAFLPPSDDPGRWLINLEELPSAVPMVQAASDHVAAHHDASTSAGRYNKRLLPRAALAAVTATMREARSRHYAQSLPWDDKGSRLLTVANYEHYTGIMDGLRERLVSQRARFIEDYDDYVEQARLDLGKLFRIEEYPSKEDLRDRFSIRYRITPVPDADHFIARLASDDTDRVKRDIERHIEEQLHDAVGDLYRRLADAVERVSERLNEDGDGKPLIFRDTMISNIRDLVDVVPRLNIFGDQSLARLCEEVKDRIAGVEPDSLRPSGTFDPVARAQVKRDADALLEQFAGYFSSSPSEPVREVA